MSELLNSVWTYLFAAIDLAIVLVASSHVVLTKRDNRAALGWVGIIWLAPIIGSLLYFTFGVNRIRRKARRLRSRESKRARRQHEQAATEELCRALEDESLHLAALSTYVQRVTDIPLVPGNRIVPLHCGDEAYPRMLAAIDSAEHSISLGTYIFDNDSEGHEFAAALARAKARGVEIRVLIDDVGTRYSFPSIKRVLRRDKITFATFLPTLVPGQFHYSNLRNHRKIMVVDGKVGFTGGMNIRAGHRLASTSRHPVRDVHFELHGPIVAQLQETFVADWEFATKEVLEGHHWFPKLQPQGPVLCRGIADGPDTRHDKLRLTLLGAIGSARRSLTIVTPYFLPDITLITAMNVAALRGVNVTIVLPEKNNLALVQWASTAQLWQVLEHGCRVFLTKLPFDHTKIVTVDDAWSFIGSANWDPRSLRLNFEFNVECYDLDFAALLNETVRARLSTARQIHLRDVDSRPLLIRIRDGIARLATPYL
ncbi:cardiolipin synthase [Anatilimnocola sp. NA78]|uniref:cardiolipin synthase n=1 Tax=Anatilimnocola sp. NA78 TaxID=3415683 RepID=UPI003CE4E38C